MAENRIPRSIINIVEGLEESLRDACAQLAGELPIREGNDFDTDKFWTNFFSATKLVSHEATKFCMAFESGGMTSTEECQCLVDKVENTCLALLAVFLTLPKTRGKMLHREISRHVLSVLQGMKNLCAAARNQSGQLQNVGDVWAHCEAVERLPKNNKDAVLELCQQQHDMVHDASQELMEAIEDEEGVELDLPLPTPRNGLQIPQVPTWSDSDRNVLFPCSGLVKAAKACIKKTQTAIIEHGNGNDVQCIAELDDIADIIKFSSSLVDDFVLSIYPPMIHSAVRQQAMLLRDNSKELLSTVKNCHFCSTTDEVWLEFLGKAIDHNWVRINDMVLTD